MDPFLSQPTFHSHALQPDRIPAIELKNEIKARAVTTDESTRSILHSALRTYPVSAAGELPKNEALMLMTRRQCTVETVDVDGCLPEKHRKTYRDEDFILHEDKSLIIFTANNNLSILKQNKHWFADGTFKVNYQSNMFLSFLVFFHMSVSRQLLSALYVTCDDDQRYHFSRLRIINRQKL